jgi:hypothetical protein
VCQRAAAGLQVDATVRQPALEIEVVVLGDRAIVVAVMGAIAVAVAVRRAGGLVHGRFPVPPAGSGEGDERDQIASPTSIMGVHNGLLRRTEAPSIARCAWIDGQARPEWIRASTSYYTLSI